MKKTYQDFLEDLAASESSGRYDVVNQVGYLGKYQMGKAALIDAGYLFIMTMEQSAASQFLNYLTAWSKIDVHFDSETKTNFAHGNLFEI